MSLSIGGLFLQLNPGGVVFNGGRQTTSRQAHLLGPHYAGNELLSRQSQRYRIISGVFHVNNSLLFAYTVIGC